MSARLSSLRPCHCLSLHTLAPWATPLTSVTFSDIGTCGYFREDDWKMENNNPPTPIPFLVCQVVQLKFQGILQYECVWLFKSLLAPGLNIHEVAVSQSHQMESDPHLLFPSRQFPTERCHTAMLLSHEGDRSLALSDRQSFSCWTSLWMMTLRKAHGRHSIFMSNCRSPMETAKVEEAFQISWRHDNHPFVK